MIPLSRACDSRRARSGPFPAITKTAAGLCLDTSAATARNTSNLLRGISHPAFPMMNTCVFIFQMTPLPGLQIPIYFIASIISLNIRKWRQDLRSYTIRKNSCLMETSLKTGNINYGASHQHHCFLLTRIACDQKRVLTFTRES